MRPRVGEQVDGVAVVFAAPQQHDVDPLMGALVEELSGALDHGLAKPLVAGVRQTLDARTAGVLVRMYWTPVTEGEVRAGAAEALRYGMEPLLAARHRKASGYSLPAVMGPPREAGAAAGRC
ncbi:hypothetical protein [Streptomyces clavuligerus]|uniref:hypothetical protein n=1 Tax=Streptomyces clavuligerus TaxID=1901 RepID=UPI00020D93AF|nr:hypothetical protein [Streptomyces clavuligerus]WDN56259.1 hypothetical protein LL058_29630 [Streptomyces clavuligerus]